MLVSVSAQECKNSVNMTSEYNFWQCYYAKSSKVVGASSHSGVSMMVSGVGIGSVFSVVG